MGRKMRPLKGEEGNVGNNGKRRTETGGIICPLRENKEQSALAWRVSKC